MSNIAWSVNSPLGNEVILKQSTFDNHIEGEEKRSEKEVANLQSVAKDVKRIVEKPRFIYCDANYDENKRCRYLDTVFMETSSAIRSLVVIVDTDRTPNEVVTWTIKRDLKQENTTKDRILYDSHAY